MNNQVEFEADKAVAINQRLRQYKKNKKLIEEAKASEKAEIDEVKNFYESKIKRAEDDNAILMAELLGFIDTEHGQTSVSTSMGNVQARTTSDSWKWGGAVAQRKAMKQLPSDLLKTVTELDKAKIKEATTITDDGKVILNETGEIIEGLSGVKGGKKQCVIRLDR